MDYERFFSENSTIKPCCLNCAMFTYWDGDFCCVQNMEIMQRGESFDEDILNTMKTNEECVDYERSNHCDSKTYEELFVNGMAGLKD